MDWAITTRKTRPEAYKFWFLVRLILEMSCVLSLNTFPFPWHTEPPRYRLQRPQILFEAAFGNKADLPKIGWKIAGLQSLKWYNKKRCYEIYWFTQIIEYWYTLPLDRYFLSPDWYKLPSERYLSSVKKYWIFIQKTLQIGISLHLKLNKSSGKTAHI